MKAGSEAPIPLFERLQIETLSHCNRDCWFCQRTYDRSGKYFDVGGAPVIERMPTVTVVDLLDQAAALGFRGRVAFYLLSEPLLDRRHFTFAEAARARGMQPYMHTNGDVLRRDADLCRRVAGAYDRIVVGLYDYRNDAELEAEKEYWRARLPGVRLAFSAIGRDGRGSGESSAIPRARAPSDSRFAAPDLVYPNGPCHRPQIRLLIQHDGTVCNCCEDMEGAFGLGNVHEAALADIWYGPRHVAVVRDLAAGHRTRHALCRDCPLPPSAPRPDGAPLDMARRHYRGSRQGMS